MNNVPPPQQKNKSPRTDRSAEAAPDSQPTLAPGERYRAPARLVGALARIESARAVFILSGLTLLGSCLIFPDIGWWPLAYVTFVPWLVAVCTARRSRLVYFTSWLLGLGYFFINIRWMIPVTLPGYIALCLYFSAFFPLAAWPIRHMYQRHGVSVALTAPIVWVAAEYLRSIGPLSFPWLLLGHSQYKFYTLIQISDLVGAYGVSFLVAMVNGWITDLLIQPILIWRTDQATRLPIGTLTTVILFVGALIYGSAQSSRKYFTDGPKVAVIQQDYPLFVDSEQASRMPLESMLDGYLVLTRQAAAEKPDLIVLPEAAMQGFINTQFINATPDDLAEMQRRRYPPSFGRAFMMGMQGWSRRIRDNFQRISDEFGVPIVLGSSSMEWKPTAIPPRVDAYNSAFLLEPGEKEPVSRYDKIHLVLFGEHVPFRFSHRWLYDYLNSITPWGKLGIEYSLTPGSRYEVFEIGAPSAGGRRFRAGTPICYEEIIPYVARTFTRGSGGNGEEKNIDILLAISNDGWFLHSSELEQHVAGAVFRAVENRIAIARSVNTGASATIHPNGMIHARVRLAENRMPALIAVGESLAKLGETTEELGNLVDSPDKYPAARQRLNLAIGAELRPAVNALGPEFLFLCERLERMSVSLAANTSDGRKKAVADFLDQIDNDSQCVERWRTRPETAPGYTIARLRCDSRVTLYTRWGDWFAQATLALVGMMLLDWMLRRLWRARMHTKNREVAQNA